MKKPQPASVERAEKRNTGELPTGSSLRHTPHKSPYTSYRSVESSEPGSGEDAIAEVSGRAVLTLPGRCSATGFGSAPQDRTCAFKWEMTLIFRNWHLSRSQPPQTHTLPPSTWDANSCKTSCCGTFHRPRTTSFFVRGAMGGGREAAETSSKWGLAEEPGARPSHPGGRRAHLRSEAGKLRGRRRGQGFGVGLRRWDPAARAAAGAVACGGRGGHPPPRCGRPPSPPGPCAPGPPLMPAMAVTSLLAPGPEAAAAAAAGRPETRGGGGGDQTTPGSARRSTSAGGSHSRRGAGGAGDSGGARAGD